MSLRSVKHLPLGLFNVIFVPGFTRYLATSLHLYTLMSRGFFQN